MYFTHFDVYSDCYYILYSTNYVKNFWGYYIVDGCMYNSRNMVYKTLEEARESLKRCTRRMIIA